MEQYIDKAILLAEIEKRSKQYTNERNTITKNNENRHVLLGRIKMCDDILSFIDTLEVKDVDLEKMWKEYFKYRGDMATVNVKHLAKHFFELGLKAKGE